MDSFLTLPFRETLLVYRAEHAHFRYHSILCSWLFFLWPRCCPHDCPTEFSLQFNRHPFIAKDPPPPIPLPCLHFAQAALILWVTSDPHECPPLLWTTNPRYLNCPTCMTTSWPPRWTLPNLSLLSSTGGGGNRSPEFAGDYFPACCPLPHNNFLTEQCHQETRNDQRHIM